MSPRPIFSVIVPFYGAEDTLRPCLSALAKAVSAQDEIIIVSDGGGEEPWARNLAQEFGAQFRSLPDNRGPAAARNLGSASARGDILFFVDADVVAAEDSVDKLAVIFAEHPEVSAVIGSYDDQPGSPGFLSQLKNLKHHYIHQKGSEKAFTFWGACGAIRQEVFRTLGGFDERYREPSIEDIELGYRLCEAGYRIQLRKEVQVKHLKRWSAWSLLRADVFYRALPWTDLILNRKHLVADLNLKHSERASAVLVQLLWISLAAAVWKPAALIVTGICALVLLILNRDFYLFLAGKRGLFFSLAAIPCHWFYFFYSGIAFWVGVLRHFAGRAGARHKKSLFGEWDTAVHKQ